MPDVIIFGTGDYALQAHYYLTTDSPHRVVAFSMTPDRCRDDSFLGLPLVPFEAIERKFPPADFAFFVPMSGRRMNRDRADFYLAAKTKGYRIVSYISSRALVLTEDIGENCFILEGANVQPFAKIGNNTTIWSQTHVGHHTAIGDHVFVSAGVGISGRCVVGDYSYLSLHAAVDAGRTVAEGTLAGISCVISRDTEPWCIYTGHPMRKRGVSSADYEFL